MTAVAIFFMILTFGLLIGGFSFSAYINAKYGHTSQVSQDDD